MANELTTEKDIKTALQTSVYPGASNESIELVLAYCRAAELDPIQKPVHIVPMWDKASGKMRDVIMPGISLYRTQAARSGMCVGISEPEFGPEVTKNLGGVETTFPEWCKVTVTRLVAGVIAPFTAKEYWIENYAAAGGKERSIAPNAMWAKRKYGQLAKCAESQALRRAFPEFAGQPTYEEMEGKEIDMGQADRVSAQAAQPEPIGLPDYQQDQFDANLPKWADLIQSGKKTADQIISMVSTKFTLSQKQIELLQSVSDKPKSKENLVAEFWAEVDKEGIEKEVSHAQ